MSAPKTWSVVRTESKRWLRRGFPYCVVNDQTKQRGWFDTKSKALAIADELNAVARGLPVDGHDVPLEPDA